MRHQNDAPPSRSDASKTLTTKQSTSAMPSSQTSPQIRLDHDQMTTNVRCSVSPTTIKSTKKRPTTSSCNQQRLDRSVANHNPDEIGKRRVKNSRLVVNLDGERLSQSKRIKVDRDLKTTTSDNQTSTNANDDCSNYHLLELVGPKQKVVSAAAPETVLRAITEADTNTKSTLNIEIVKSRTTLARILTPDLEEDQDESNYRDSTTEVELQHANMTATSINITSLSPAPTPDSLLDSIPTRIKQELNTDDTHLTESESFRDVSEDDFEDEDVNNHRHSFGQQSSFTISDINRHQQHKLTEAQLDRLSSLIKIIREGDYNEFLELLEMRGFKSLLNVFVDGQTVLHYSLIYGRSLAWCKQLILNGANPNLTNRAGWHPIHLAAFNGSRETMRYLIDCIAV